MPHRPEIQQRDRIVIVSATEDLDIASAPEFTEAALRGVPNDVQGVVVDLSRARYVDSAGVRAMFTIADALSRRQLHFHVVTCPDSAVGRVLHVVQLDSTAHIFEELEEAVSALQAATA